MDLSDTIPSAIAVFNTSGFDVDVAGVDCDCDFDDSIICSSFYEISHDEILNLCSSKRCTREMLCSLSS